jgi:hypothetical protein
MSASLMVLIPLALLGLVTALCFVGCVLPVGGLPSDLGPYQGDTIIGTNSLVAFWPLNDKTKALAADIAPKASPAMPFNGVYNDAVAIGLTGIVPGDVPLNSPTRNACASFSGGSVSVMFHAELNPDPPFTLDCWVQPTWTDTNTHAVVISTNLDPMMNSGYGLFCDEKNMWNAVIGLGQGNGFLTTTPTAGTPAASLGKPCYLALTFDGSVLSVFMTVVGDPFNPAPVAQATVSVGKFAKSVSALQLFIGKGRPDMPPGQYPFMGQIQDVAFYNALLQPADLMTHFNVGSGQNT